MRFAFRPRVAATPLGRLGSPLAYSEYRCVRCGITAHANSKTIKGGRPLPEFCPDCRPYAKEYYR